MGQTNVQQFAGELGVQPDLFCWNSYVRPALRKGSVRFVDRQDKTRLLDYLRKMAVGRIRSKKITLTRRETSEIRKPTRPARHARIQVECARSVFSSKRDPSETLPSRPPRRQLLLWKPKCRRLRSKLSRHR